MGIVKSSRIVTALAIGALAGFAGGLAEIVWVSLYGTVTGTPVAPVARGVVVSLFPALGALPWSIALGILIHMVLAIGLGMGLALVFRFASRGFRIGESVFGLTLLALAGVWAVNFLIVLPHLNPAFVHILPYAVTLLSKLLFGFSAASVFRADRGSEVRLLAR